MFQWGPNKVKIAGCEFGPPCVRCLGHIYCTRYTLVPSNMATHFLNLQDRFGRYANVEFTQSFSPKGYPSL